MERAGVWWQVWRAECAGTNIGAGQCGVRESIHRCCAALAATSTHIDAVILTNSIRSTASCGRVMYAWTLECGEDWLEEGLNGTLEEGQESGQSVWAVRFIEQ